MPLTISKIPIDQILGFGDFSDLYFEETQALSIRWEGGRVQSVTDSENAGVGVRYLVGPETRYAHK